MTQIEKLQKRITELEAAKNRADILYEISLELNTALDEEALLQVLARPAIEMGAFQADLLYIDWSETTHPTWIDIIASWNRNNQPAFPPGSRFNLRELPSARLWLANPKQALLISDIRQDERIDDQARALFNQLGGTALVNIPLTHAGRWIGLILFSWDAPHAFDAHERMIYDALPALASPAIASRRLLIERQKAQMETLYHISRRLNRVENETELLEVLVEQLAQKEEALEMTLMYNELDEAGQPEWAEKVAIWRRDNRPLVELGTRYRLADFPLVQLLEARPGDPFFIEDIDTDKRVDPHTCQLFNELQAKAMVIIPLLQTGRWVGFLTIAWAEPRQFSPHETALYRALTGLVAPTLENRRLITRLEQMVAERTQALRLKDRAIESSINAIALADLTGLLTYVNPSFLAWWGYQVAEEVLDRPAVSFWEREEEAAQVVEALQTEGCWFGELMARRKDGSTFEVQLSASLIVDESGQPIHMLASFIDITDRKKAERALAQYTEELARSNAELEQFAYVASHDLQEPLRKIRTFGDRLSGKYQDVLDNRGQDYLARMQNAAGRMQTLIDDLLVYSRITTKKQKFVPVDLNHTLQEVTLDLEINIEQLEGRVEAEALPTIEADPLQMRQLLQNLISNSLKFHRPEEPPVIRLYSQPHASGKIQLMVADNGIGFDEKYLDRIFNSFQRLHSREEYEGTGIGLAIARRIVEHHQGAITARSQPGRGATFIITLPQKQPERYH